MQQLKSPRSEEDFESWNLYKKTEHRWVFNKLEVALHQGLHAGPAATAPEHSGKYIMRPIYNIYGMGIGAKAFTYDKNLDYDSFINHSVVPPGYFWCQFVKGNHLSIDYNQDVNGFWHTRSVWQGRHENKDNFTRFASWTRLDNVSAPEWNKLPMAPSFLYDPEVTAFNIEMIGKHIIEIHLRLGNDPFDEYPVDSEIIPVWNDELAPEGEWKGNLHQDMELYSASGYLSDVRRGYVVRKPR
jgi:hypothetical protein